MIATPSRQIVVAGRGGEREKRCFRTRKWRARFSSSPIHLGALPFGALS